MHRLLSSSTRLGSVPVMTFRGQTTRQHPPHEQFCPLSRRRRIALFRVPHIVTRVGVRALVTPSRRALIKINRASCSRLRRSGDLSRRKSKFALRSATPQRYIAVQADMPARQLGPAPLANPSVDGRSAIAHLLKIAASFGATQKMDARQHMHDHPSPRVLCLRWCQS